MLCVRAEDALAAAAAVAMASDKMRSSVTLGGSIQRAMQRMGGGGGRRSAGSSRALPQSAPRLAAGSGDASASASCSGDDSSNGGGNRERIRRGGTRRYRSQLEQEVRNLQRQLQEEIDMHLALTDAIAYNAEVMLKSSTKLPNKAQELIISISSLEITVSKLEKDLNDLRYQLCHVRNERLLVENFPECILSTPSTSKCTWDEHISTLRDFKLGEYEPTQSMQEYLFPELEDQQDVEKGSKDREMVCPYRLLEEHQDVHLDTLLEEQQDEEMQETGSMEKDGKEDQGIDASSFSQLDLKKHGMKGNMWNNPNQLSEDMVRSMRDIFLHLSESSKISPKISSDNLSSSAECLSGSTFTSVSDSSLMASVLRSPSVDSGHDDDIIDEVENFDPYNVNGEARRDIGKYCSVTEVSWMHVGKGQLEYASDALKKFRALVEQLSKVDPTSTNCDERLAFWINLYNALIMHAYLAYGVPGNDIKLFSLMQKACYMVGGQSFSAAEIEFVILKMKSPAHRPQISLMLALHKFRITEEHKKYSIDDTEPLVLFALSSGMFSSPAVKVFSATNVRQELQESMRDYIRASVGINDKGKLVVPTLLQSYAKGTVVDSLLADWICRQLTPDQVAAIQDTTSSRKQRLLGVRSFSVIPFDSKFRYLFLPDKH